MGTYDVVRDLFWVTEVTSIDAMYQSCNTLNPGNGMGSVIASQMGGTWAVGDLTFTVYNHVGPPGSTSCSGMAGMMMPGETAMVNESFQLPPTSNHSGGVNLLLGDGSVRFIKNSVSLNACVRSARATAPRSSVPPTFESDSITVSLTAGAVAQRAIAARDPAGTAPPVVQDSLSS